MLNKLIKYEFRSTYKILTVIYVLVLLIAPFGTSGRVFLDKLSNMNIINSDLYDIFAATYIFLYVIILMSANFITIYFLVNRFYKNMTSNEGYLMHTLPVSVHDLLLSKIIVSSIWSFIACLSTIFSVIILVSGFTGFDIIFNVISGLFQEIFSFAPISNAIVITELIIMGIISVPFGIMVFYASVCIGHTVKKHKFLGSVAGYIGITTVFNILSSILSPFYFALFSKMESLENIYTPVIIIFLISILISLVMLVGLYFVMQYILKNHLNLE